MNRTRTAVIALAAVVGVAGGVGTAVATTSGASSSSSPGAATTADDPAGAPSSSAPDASSSAPAPADPTATPSDDQTAPADEPLLYYVPGEIHDGDTVVPFAQGSPVTSLVRRDGGYLVGISDEEGYNDALWTVTDDGVVERIGYVSPGWDLNLQRTRVVANDLEQDLLTVYDTATAEPVTRWDGVFGDRDSAAYAGSEDQVLISTRRDARQYDLQRWDVAAGTATDERQQGFQDMSASPGGSYVAGRVSSEGEGSDDEAYCLSAHQTFLRKEPASWLSCDWVAYAGGPKFSPDGTRILVVPAATEGLGPARFGVVDASDGLTTPVLSFDAPDSAFDARWADNDHVYVVGGDPAGDSGWIQRCDLQGACTEVTRSDAAVPTVGEVR